MAILSKSEDTRAVQPVWWLQKINEINQKPIQDFKKQKCSIDQFRYIKIQPKTIDLNTRLWGITTELVGFILQSLVLRSSNCCYFGPWSLVSVVCSLVVKSIKPFMWDFKIAASRPRKSLLLGYLFFTLTNTVVVCSPGSTSSSGFRFKILVEQH